MEPTKLKIGLNGTPSLYSFGNPYNRGVAPSVVLNFQYNYRLTFASLKKEAISFVFYNLSSFFLVMQVWNLNI